MKMAINLREVAWNLSEQRNFARFWGKKSIRFHETWIQAISLKFIAICMKITFFLKFFWPGSVTFPPYGSQAWLWGKKFLLKLLSKGDMTDLYVSKFSKHSNNFWSVISFLTWCHIGAWVSLSRSLSFLIKDPCRPIPQKI